jgi:2',3'-cyclic-nucleotide 2'-phosphodiesterase (5'-nucleotidase family)
MLYHWLMLTCMLGDLHDGNGLSDASYPDGVYSNPIFDVVNYDVLTIGTKFDLPLSHSVPFYLSC